MKKEHARYEASKALLLKRGFKVIPDELVRELGAECAFLFEHLRSLEDFFSDSTRIKDDVAWFFRSDEAVADFMGIKPRRVSTLRKVLIGKKLLKMKIMCQLGGKTRAVFYSIDTEGFSDFVELSNAEKVHLIKASNAEKVHLIPLSNAEKVHLIGDARLLKRDRINTKKQKSQSDALLGSEDGKASSKAIADTAPRDVLGGRYDDLASADIKKMSTSLLDAFLRIWGGMWGKDLAKIKITAKRKKAWASAQKDGVSPSGFAKAIIGMRHDPWKDRVLHNDWDAVARSAEKWIALYEENKNMKPNPIQKPSTRTKVVEGIIVPSSYKWTPQDSHCAAQGWKFNLETEKWEA